MLTFTCCCYALFGSISSADVIVQQGYAWMIMSNVTLHVRKRSTLIHGLVVLLAGTARGFPTKSLGKSHPRIEHQKYFFACKIWTCHFDSTLFWLQSLPFRTEPTEQIWDLPYIPGMLWWTVPWFHVVSSRQHRFPCSVPISNSFPRNVELQAICTSQGYKYLGYRSKPQESLVSRFDK